MGYIHLYTIQEIMKKRNLLRNCIWSLDFSLIE